MMDFIQNAFLRGKRKKEQKSLEEIMRESERIEKEADAERNRFEKAIMELNEILKQGK